MNCHAGGPADMNAKADGAIAARRSAPRAPFGRHRSHLVAPERRVGDARLSLQLGRRPLGLRERERGERVLRRRLCGAWAPGGRVPAGRAVRRARSRSTRDNPARRHGCEAARAASGHAIRRFVGELRSHGLEPRSAAVVTQAAIARRPGARTHGHTRTRRNSTVARSTRQSTPAVSASRASPRPGLERWRQPGSGGPHSRSR